ncbi:hypothetical protein M899_2140 [Bacteriovorax sp. BSW11_IV]|uniref:hypothetical protein n=1 Tax=Bacteriovorax sp. BSW11_IV TaxID=1353529 RepID=UPI00038A4ACE|nr:hypothetical protein [Bacteriovorax sp. BSW11_IV]EQC47842.1 hypothetical protein M899_2140 [Bacteriovorax sp. BSW11_IV]
MGNKFIIASLAIVTSSCMFVSDKEVAKVKEVIETEQAAVSDNNVEPQSATQQTAPAVVEVEAPKLIIEAPVVPVKKENVTKAKKSAKVVKATKVTKATRPVTKNTPETKPATVVDTVSTQAAATSEIAANSITTDLDSSTMNLGKKFGASLSLTTSTSVLETDSYDSYVTSSAQLAVSYKLTDKISLKANGSVDKNFKGERDQSFSSAYLGVSAPLKDFGTTISTAASGGYYFPVNADQRRNTSYNGRALGKLSANIDLRKVGLKYVSLSLSTAFAKNFHEFKRTASNGANTNYYITNLVALTYAPFAKGGLTAYFSNTTKWDYENERGSDSFALGQSFDWSFDKNFAISVGHELGGKTYGYTGRQFDVSLFDKSKSSVYTSLIYTL